jgi:hypothetical protein
VVDKVEIARGRGNTVQSRGEIESKAAGEGTVDNPRSVVRRWKNCWEQMQLYSDTLREEARDGSHLLDLTQQH